MKPSLWNKGYGLLYIFINSATLRVSCVASSDCFLGLHEGKIAMDCKYSNLRDLPGNIPMEIQKLSMPFNYLSRITDQFRMSNCSWGNNSALCSKFPFMTELYISYNLLKEISPYSFSGMKELQIIMLKENLLKTLHRDTFSDNRLLEVIVLSENSINFVDPELFQNLKYLKYLSLENNQIHNLHCDTFKGLENLETLWINSNLLTNLDSHIFRDLGQLTVLRIDQNHLHRLSYKLLENVVKLVIMNASKNNLSYLSPTLFSNTKKLLHVDVSHNYISKISKYQFQDLLKIYKVNFSFNSLTTLYLSQIPVILTHTSDIKVLQTDYKICSDDFIGDSSCFASEKMIYGFDKSVFHDINFSFNNISKIVFNKKELSPSLQVLKLSLSGNYALHLPISFLKKERYIVQLKLDKSNLNWRNVTLFNEILQLPQLKFLSLVGSAACEFYMQQVLFSVFNPNGRLRIICDMEHAVVDLEEISPLKSDVFVSHTDGKSEDVLLENNLTGNCSGLYDEAEDANYSCEYPCECDQKKTVIFEQFQGTELSVECDYTMDCSYSSLLVLPELTQSASCVLMSHNHIEDVQGNAFFTSPLTVHLDLSFNNLQELPSGIFNFLTNLRFLKLNNNHLTYLDASLFANLTNLTYLLLHGNKITSYAADTFIDLQNLVVLSVDFSNLTKFHDDMFDNQLGLEHLVMHGTLNSGSLSSISVNLGNLHNLLSCRIIGFNLNLTQRHTFLEASLLHTLQFEKNLLLSLSDELFNSMVNLVNISLGQNTIKVVEKNAFRYLTKLAHLDISNNLIEYLHCDLFLDTVELSVLNISNNKISYISARIFEPVNKLKYLDLSSNDIVGMKWNMFSKLPNLLLLRLHKNNIITTNESYLGVSSCVSNCKIMLPDLLNCFGNDSRSFQQLRNTRYDGTNTTITSKLEIILVHDNNIVRLEKNAFTDYPFLRILSVHSNKISQIDNEVFHATPRLKELALQHNHIASINKTLFKNLIRLEILFLNHNHLEFIEEGAFIDLAMLKVLALNSNRLKFFDPMLPSNNSLSILNLNENYITRWNAKQYFPVLDYLLLQSNPLEEVNIYDTMPVLKELTVANTSITKFENDAFRYLSEIIGLDFNYNCLQGLSPSIFASVPKLNLIEIIYPASRDCGVGSQLDWRNITLINYWFDMHYLDYLVLNRHPICEDTQRIQIIENIFLSERWKNVICKDDKLPDFAISPDVPKLIKILSEKVSQKQTTVNYASHTFLRKKLNLA